MNPHYLFITKMLSVFIICLVVLLCCVFSSPDGNVAGVSPVQPGLGGDGHRFPLHSPPCLGTRGRRGPDTAE